jgi:hypothetical protein
MSGQDLAAYLKSVPGSLVEKIELIDNPSARYDAAGNAIINIRLKKNKVGGFTGNVSTGYSQGRYARNNDALNINYNHKKLNLFGNFGYNHEKSYSIDIYDRRFFNTRNEPSSAVSLENNQKFRSNGININTGVDYTASANTTFGFIVNSNRNKRFGRLDYISDNYTLGNTADTTGRGSVTGGDKRSNLGLNLNFQHKLGKPGRELSGDVNYLNYHNNGDQSLQNFLYKPNGDLTDASHFLYLLPSDIHIYTVKADYVHPLKNKLKLEGGFKSSIVDNNNISDYYTVMNSSLTKENSKSNHFKYHENINAAYINGQKSWKRVAIQMGLRFENTQAVGQQVGNAAVPLAGSQKTIHSYSQACM